MTLKDTKPEETPEENDTEGSLIEAIGSSTIGMQNTFTSIYSTLEKSLQQNVQMTQSMIQMIDEMFKANLKIGSTLEPTGNGNIKLALVISNRTRLPTIAMTGSLKLEVEDDQIDILYKSAYKDIEKTEELQNIFETPCNLPPQSQYRQDIEISLKELVQCSGYILVSIPNPLDHQKPINIKHSFGLYLVDQFIKEISKDKEDLEIVKESSYSIAFIRIIMEIHPIKGIDVGMYIKLSSAKVQINCEIKSISSDFNTLDVQFSSNNKEIACKVIAELNILSGLF